MFCLVFQRKKGQLFFYYREIRSHLVFFIQTSLTVSNRRNGSLVQRIIAWKSRKTDLALMFEICLRSTYQYS